MGRLLSETATFRFRRIHGVVATTDALAFFDHAALRHWQAHLSPTAQCQHGEVVFIRFLPDCRISNEAGRRGTVPPSRNLVGPDLEAAKVFWPEGLGDRHIGGVAPTGDQDAADLGTCCADRRCDQCPPI